MNTAADKEAVIKSVFHGDPLTQFVTGVTSARQTVQADGTTVEADLAVAHVDVGLNAIARNVFTHKALQNQKKWMHQGMRKPSDMKNSPIPKKLKFLKLSLTLIVEESVPVDKEKLVTFTLKSKASATGRSS